MKFTKFASSMFTRVYEDPSDPPGSGNPPPKNDPPPPATTFSTEDMNRIVQERLAKASKKHEKEMASMRGRVESLNLSSKQREELEDQMEQMRLESSTKEEQSAAQLKKMEKAWSKEKESLVGERDSIHRLYTSEKIERDIFAAALAGENKAVNPQQIVDILAPRTRVVPVLGEDGKPTGKMKTVVPTQETKEDGSVTELLLTPVEALAKMKEQPDRHGNLFVSGAKSGLGGSGNRSGGSNKSNPMDGSMDDVMKMYRQSRT